MKNELINIISQEGSLVVGSREIATNFDKQHKHVLEKIENLIKDMVKNNSADFSTQYFITTEYKDISGKMNKEYLLTRDGFSLLVMGFTGSKALQWKIKYIDVFNRMEEELKSKSIFKLPQTYKEALVELIGQIELNEQLQIENEVLKPKGDYYDDVLKSEKLVTTTDIAKDLSMTAQKLNKLFKEKIILFKQSNSWKPYSEYQWLIPEYCDYEINEYGQLLKWTEKGRQWIIDILNNF